MTHHEKLGEKCHKLSHCTPRTTRGATVPQALTHCGDTRRHFPTVRTHFRDNEGV